MIGQKNVIKKLKESTAPFIILTGEKGSGKKTLLLELFNTNLMWVQNTIWVSDVSVDSIRNMISNANKQYNKLFIITDADRMSTSAKNALLKVVEECPNNNRFIMTVNSTVNMLPTILSRAVIISMEIYTDDELNQAITSDMEDILDICTNIGDIKLMESYGDDFINYVHLVFDNIAEVPGSNALKIGNKIAFKNEQDKYDMRLFLKAFRALCIKRYMECRYIYCTSWVLPTTLALIKLELNGINKSALFDMWILDVREIKEALNE